VDSNLKCEVVNLLANRPDSVGDAIVSIAIVVSGIGIDVMASLVTGTRRTEVRAISRTRNMGFVASKSRRSGQDDERQNGGVISFQVVPYRHCASFL